MADPGLTRITVGGQQFDVDQDALDSLAAKGIDYQNDTPILQRIEQGASDLGRIAAHGATLGYIDKKFGDSNQSINERLGDEEPYAGVERRNPVMAPVGEIGASLLLPVPKGAVAAKGAGLAERGIAALSRAATQSTVGAGTGAARAYAEGEDPVAGAEVGGALGGLGSAAVDTVAGLGKTAAKYGGKMLNSVADVARTAPYAIGGSDKQLAAIAEKFGVDKVPAKLAAIIEEMLPNNGRLLGRNRQQIVSELNQTLDEEGPRLADIRNEIGTTDGVNALIPDAWKSLRERLAADASGQSSRTGEGRALKSALQSDLEAFDAAGQPKTVSDVAGIKSEYQSAGHTGKLGTVADSAIPESAAQFGKQIRKTLEDDLLAYAKDENQAEHALSNDRYAKAALLADQITPKSLREALASNAGDLGAAVLGAGTGAALGAVGGDYAGEHGKTGALAGALFGLQMSTNTGTRSYMRQLMAKPQAMDTIANILRASGKKIEDLDLNKLAELIQASTGKVGGYIGGQ